MARLKETDKDLYYFEGSKVVFTPEYHIERGYCCGNGCRHCPYEPKHIKGNKELEKEYKTENDGND
jgi:2-iminoacetate synthase ThiH